MLPISDDMRPCPTGCRDGVIGVKAVCFRCDGTGVVPIADEPQIRAGAAYRADMQARGVTVWAEHERLRVAYKTLLLVLYGGLPVSELTARKGEIFIVRGKVLADTNRAAEAASRTRPAKRAKPAKPAKAAKPDLFA